MSKKTGGALHKTGSSPRMRGTPSPRGPASSSGRIIPAHAGNSGRLPNPNLGSSDHPRACGELPMLVSHSCASCGSSPRMRGTPTDQARIALDLRIIPAHAGNSCDACRRARVETDHPRACGELRRCLVSRRSAPRIIPAHAGNSVVRRPIRTASSDHPRACGELHNFLEGHRRG